MNEKDQRREEGTWKDPLIIAIENIRVETKTRRKW